MSPERVTRRQVLGGQPAVRLAPRVDLINTLEFEEQAKLALPAAAFARIAGSDRVPFDRITLRPRMMVPMTTMDLGLTLLGDALFAPILVGPVANQKQFHPDGEVATARGASAARSPIVISSHSSVGLDELRSALTTPFWYQVFAGDDGAAARVKSAVSVGCRAVCVTIGAAPLGTTGRFVRTTAAGEWQAVAALKKTAGVPVLVKGVTTPEAARLAVQHDLQGLIVSNHGGLPGHDGASLVLTLPRIVEAVGGRMPVLVDGGFRRGTDILKALAFGATAVLVSRPVMWGLAAYGADGVQTVVEMLQTELARYMAMCGKPTLKVLDASLLKVHQA